MIVGVAIRNDKVIIQLPEPNRHCDCFKYATSIGIDAVKEEIGTAVKDQGFYTRLGRYLNRKEAASYARRVKQIDAPVSILFSEDLW